jgi:DNA replication and repair protein RecF
LLEAVYFLATSRSPQARADRQVIRWEAESEPLPFARLGAEVEKAGRHIRLEVTVAPAGEPNGSLTFRKQIRINGAPRRALDLVGEMKVVLFLPQDIDLVAGSPAGRRHFLDVALCQIDRAYCDHLSSYNQVLLRRNHLLRQLKERGGDQEQLLFWDEQAAAHAGYVVTRRRGAAEVLAGQATRIHEQLSGGCEALECFYAPSLWPTADRLRPIPKSAEEISAQFRTRWRTTRAREIDAGATLIGPHRDDLHLRLRDHDLQQFGSRGQQRTAAMALKLAEVELMRAQTGERPILLLDDVMSELDEGRRAYLAGLLEDAEQALVTTTDLGDFAPAFLGQAEIWHVLAGSLAVDAPAEPAVCAGADGA